MPLTSEEKDLVIDHLAMRLAEESVERMKLLDELEQWKRGEDFYETTLKQQKLIASLQDELRLVRSLNFDSPRRDCGKC